MPKPEKNRTLKVSISATPEHKEALEKEGFEPFENEVDGAFVITSKDTTYESLAVCMTAEEVADFLFEFETFGHDVLQAILCRFAAMVEAGEDLNFECKEPDQNLLN